MYVYINGRRVKGCWLSRSMKIFIRMQQTICFCRISNVKYLRVWMTASRELGGLMQTRPECRLASFYDDMKMLSEEFNYPRNEAAWVWLSVEFSSASSSITNERRTTSITRAVSQSSTHVSPWLVHGASLSRSQETHKYIHTDIQRPFAFILDRSQR